MDSIHFIFILNYGGIDKSLTFGFYPSIEVDLNNQVVPNAIFDDSGHEYSVSVTLELSCDDFNQALQYTLIASENNYDLNEYNCSDFGISIANSVNLGVADTSSPWEYLGEIFGNSSNPGDLGEDIKELSEGLINSYGGIAPSTHCD